jgi:hypothetical protein
VNAQTSGRSDVRHRSRADVARKDGRTLRRKTIYFPIPVAKRLELYCTVKDLDVSDVTAQAVEAWLNKHSDS